MSNKLLVSQVEAYDNVNVSFQRDFIDEGLLGSGTFADVFRVRQRRILGGTEDDGMGKHFAVKKSRRPFRSKKDREWLLNEVRTMKRIGHQHNDYIIKLVRAWQEGGFFYVQIDLAERGTLKDLMLDLNMAGLRVPDNTVWHVLHDVSAGLHHIHSCGMVHLDVKPANLLLAEGGIVKIGDFGMAVERGCGEDGHEGDTRCVWFLVNLQCLFSSIIFLFSFLFYGFFVIINFPSSMFMCTYLSTIYIVVLLRNMCWCVVW